MINHNKKNNDICVIPDTAFIHLMDIRQIVPYCHTGCTISNKCSHFERCISQATYTAVKVNMQNGTEIKLPYAKYKILEKAMIDYGMLEKELINGYL